MKTLPIPLYHGTSTFFLESIITHGLGGVNPLNKLHLFEFCQELLPIIEIRLSKTKFYHTYIGTFRHMVDQGSASFQHGQPYLSPSLFTAARYTVSNAYGSEILSHSLGFLKELIPLDDPLIKGDLYRKYHTIYGLLDVTPAPIVIRIDEIDVTKLQDEYGNDPTPQLTMLEDLYKKSPETCGSLLQQSNFRLLSPISIDTTKIWLTTATSRIPCLGIPSCRLYPINTAWIDVDN